MVPLRATVEVARLFSLTSPKPTASENSMKKLMSVEEPVWGTMQMRLIILVTQIIEKPPHHIYTNSNYYLLLGCLMLQYEDKDSRGSLNYLQQAYLKILN